MTFLKNFLGMFVFIIGLFLIPYGFYQLGSLISPVFGAGFCIACVISLVFAVDSMK